MTDCSAQQLFVYYKCPCCLADLVEFTDEEGYGRYLDLHDCYLKYINLKSIEVIVITYCISL